MTVKINSDRVAVDHSYFWQPMETCPPHTKVQLLNPGGCIVYGKWNGRDNYWKGWAPLPKVRKE